MLKGIVAFGLTRRAIVLLGLFVFVIAGLVAFTARTARKIAAAFPPPGRFMEIDGQRLHYVDKGQGPAIVMISGRAFPLTPDGTWMLNWTTPVT